MAVVLPLLLLFVFGIIDFGRMLNEQINVTEGAHEAARVASFGGDASSATDRAKLIAGDDIDVDVQACPLSGTTEDDAEVTVTHTFTFVTPVGLIGSGFDGEVTLTGQGVVPCS